MIGNFYDVFGFAIGFPPSNRVMTVYFEEAIKMFLFVLVP